MKLTNRFYSQSQTKIEFIYNLKMSAQMSRQPEEDLEDLRKKFHLLEGDRKGAFQTTQLDR